MMLYEEFIDAGYRVFGLHQIDKKGNCTCSNDHCKALGKHPVAANWQHTPHWSEDQLETLIALGQFSTGYGVLVSGLLVIDVDARNGGVESYNKLMDDIPQIAGAGMIVNTGSGNGSQHLYFKLPEQTALVQSLPSYPGIDFKSSGFVVGPGSIHASGNIYDCVVGSPADIDDAPPALLDLLKKPDRYRGVVDSHFVDVSDDEIDQMLAHIENNEQTDYETWIRVGMALHHITTGSPDGEQKWREWSAKSPKHDPEDMGKKWHSFGKSTNPVTLATLMHYAQDGGWIRPVSFTAEWMPELCPVGEDAIDTTGIDLDRPPGFVGEVAQWINDQSLYPRERLATAAALMATSNIGGMRYNDPLDHSSLNLFCFGVAGSSTGKESILQAHNELLRAAGISSAIVGGIKSEQEIYRNLIRNQAAFYCIDEFGEQLSKISNSKKQGGAAYLQGVVGTLMSIYSKSNSFAAITGDLKEEIKQKLLDEAKRLQKQIDENDDRGGHKAKRLERIGDDLKAVDMGIENPFLSIFGLTTPELFDTLMSFDMAVNGFIGRSIIFREKETNPKIKPRVKRKKYSVPDKMRQALWMLYAPGHSIAEGSRVERIGDKADIQTSSDVYPLLDQIEEYFHALAQSQVEETGLQAIPRRGYEHVAKISAVLAMPSGLRTVEHVRWAFALIKADINEKMALTCSNSEKGASALANKILTLISTDHGETVRAIKRSCRSYDPSDVEKAINMMVEAGKVRMVEEIPKRGGMPSKKIYSVD